MLRPYMNEARRKHRDKTQWGGRSQAPPLQEASRL